MGEIFFSITLESFLIFILFFFQTNGFRIKALKHFIQCSFFFKHWKKTYKNKKEIIDFVNQKQIYDLFFLIFFSLLFDDVNVLDLIKFQLDILNKSNKVEDKESCTTKRRLRENKGLHSMWYNSLFSFINHFKYSSLKCNSRIYHNF